jgi:hypothetical protein
MTKEINYIVDSKGKKTAVQIPIAEWKAMQKKLLKKNTFIKTPSKKTNSDNVKSMAVVKFLNETKKGLEEIKRREKTNDFKGLKSLSEVIAEL